jgi:hypothetical protein
VTIDVLVLVDLGATDRERGPNRVTDQTQPSQHDARASPAPPFAHETGERRLLEFCACGLS